MLRFVLRRLLASVCLVAAAATLALLLTRLAPADLTTQLGPFATAAEIAATRARFGLDRPPLAQWSAWLGRVVRFDFGESFLYNRPVGPMVVRAAGHTLLLGSVALIVATALGLGAGLVTGSRRGGPLSGALRVTALCLLSTPPLLAALLWLMVAARTGWFPIGGMTASGAVHVSWGSWLVDVARHLPVPVLALALPLAGTLERIQASALRQQLREPYARAAAARGAPPGRVTRRHAFPVSLRAVSGVYGVAVGTLLSGSFVVEYMTAWPGLSRLLYDALRARDIYLVTGCAAMGAAVLAFGLFVGELLLAASDPRVREVR